MLNWRQKLFLELYCHPPPRREKDDLERARDLRYGDPRHLDRLKTAFGEEARLREFVTSVVTANVRKPARD